MELVVTEIQRPELAALEPRQVEFMLKDARVDGLVRLEIERDLLFLSLIGQDRANEQHEAVGWYTIIQFQALLGTSDGREHR